MRVLKTALVGFVVFGFIGCGSGPSDEVVRNIASQYANKMYKDPSKIKIIKSYEKDGKTVIILQLENMICEMPMLKFNDNWTATGINCQG